MLLWIKDENWAVQAMAVREATEEDIRAAGWVWHEEMETLQSVIDSAAEALIGDGVEHDPAAIADELVGSADKRFTEALQHIGSGAPGPTPADPK